MDKAIILINHALRILKYSEKHGRNALVQLSTNQQKKKKTHFFLSIYLPMKNKITAFVFNLYPEKVPTNMVIPR